ncbi:hypothetical protein [Alkalicoccobacillus gibsonii]|uniref:hypothetical protein n=1 Tax=Alkalicoccobacillus gibsonii TaxID=79881 RepID=UPI003515E7DD
MTKAGLIIALVLLFITLIDFKRRADRNMKLHQLILKDLNLKKGSYSIHSFGKNQNDFILTSNELICVITFDNSKRPNKIEKTEFR